MLKTLAILAVLIATIGVSGQPNKATDQKQDVTQDVKPIPIGTDTANKGDHGKTNQPEASGRPPAGNTPIERSHWWADPNWWLVVVAGLTGVVIGWQSNETRKAAQAARDSNRQNAEFFRTEKRPWVGISGSLSLREKKSAKTGHYGFTVEYTVKNFGVAPAFNTIVVLGATIDDVNNYALVKSKVDDARKTAEDIVNMTGDLLLPGGEKCDTYLFGESQRVHKIVIPGCIVYRFADGTVHYTELSYWMDDGRKAIFRPVWFQSAN